MIRKNPKTKLNLSKLLKGHKKTELALLIGVPYTQLYKYLEDGANPTLLMLERLAEGLSKLRNEKITLNELLDLK